MTKKGCHAEALEACAQGIANYELAVMHDVEAFTLTLRVPQGDTRFKRFKKTYEVLKTS